MAAEPATSPSVPPSPSLHPHTLTLFSHGLATLSLVATLPSPQSRQTTLTFTPPTYQLHDILKTLVVFADNATVNSINYPLHDPNVAPEERDQNLSIGFEDVLLDLLNAAIGTRVSLTHPFRAGDPDTSKFSSVHHRDNGVCTGTLVGLQSFQVAFPNHPGHCSHTQDQYVLLQAPSGQLRKILLRAVTDVSFHDKAVNRRFTDALNREKCRVAIAETPITITISPTDHPEQQTYSTTGPSKVTVRYAVESPVYKLTHRLILPSMPEPMDPTMSPSEDDNILFQVWAIIDSPFSYDLQDISVSLIAGKPMSFRHDLASKRYIDRPEEVVDKGPGYGKPSLGATQLKKRRRLLGKDGGFSFNTARRSKGGGLGGAVSDHDSEDDSSDDSDDDRTEDLTPPRKQLAPMAARSQSTASVQGMGVSEVGDLYEYRIPHRVTLRANESALLPVISRQVKGGKVLVYAQDVHERYALSAVRLVNPGEATVEKGPVSVYEEDILVGEGMMDSLLPGKQALVPYAIDGSVSIHFKPVEREGSLVQVRYVNGWLRAVKWQEMETAYSIENSGSRGRVFFLLHRRSHGFGEGDVDVTREDGGVVEVSTETEGEEVKYKLNLWEGCTTLRVVDRSKKTEKYNLETSCTKDGIAMLLCGGVVSDEVADKMKNIMKLKADITSQDIEIERLEQELGTVEEDQERYRKNLTSLGGVLQVNRFKDGGVMDRYVRELEQSEDRIRQLRERIKNERLSASAVKLSVQDQVLEVAAMMEK